MATVDDTTYSFRAARPEDTEAIEALDGSFTTATVFRVQFSEGGFTLRETPRGAAPDQGVPRGRVRGRCGRRHPGPAGGSIDQW